MFGTSLGDVCKDCGKRIVGCHGNCEKYINAKNRYLDRKKKDRDIKQSSYIGLSENKARTKNARLQYYRNFGV